MNYGKLLFHYGIRRLFKFLKYYFCSQEVLQQLRLFWHRVYANRDVGNAAEQITKADSAEVNAGVSTKLIQVRVTIFAIFCIQHEIFPHRWSTPGHHKMCHGHRGGHRWGCDGKCGGHRWVTLGCQHERAFQTVY